MRTRGHEVVQFHRHERSLGDEVRMIIQQVVDGARHIQHRVVQWQTERQRGHEGRSLFR